MKLYLCNVTYAPMLMVFNSTKTIRTAVNILFKVLLVLMTTSSNEPIFTLSVANFLGNKESRSSSLFWFISSAYTF